MPRRAEDGRDRPDVRGDRRSNRGPGGGPDDWRSVGADRTAAPAATGGECLPLFTLASAGVPNGNQPDTGSAPVRARRVLNAARRARTVGSRSAGQPAFRWRPPRWTDRPAPSSPCRPSRTRRCTTPGSSTTRAAWGSSRRRRRAGVGRRASCLSRSRPWRLLPTGARSPRTRRPATARTGDPAHRRRAGAPGRRRRPRRAGHRAPCRRRGLPAGRSGLPGTTARAGSRRRSRGRRVAGPGLAAGAGRPVRARA